MKSLNYSIWKALFCLFLSSVGLLADIERQPLHGGVALEYGQLFNSGNALINTGSPGSFPIDQYTMHRTMGWFVQSATVDERFDVTVGVGGIFFYWYPDAGYSFTRSTVSAVSLIQASGTYSIGDLEQPSLKLSFGLLPYKYNFDSKNLGEYLFRSTPYPNTVSNGGWDVVNSSYARNWGLLVEKPFMDGKWKNDFMINMSTRWPLYDLSLAYVTAYTFGEVFELGGGVNFFHVIPNRPSATKPKRVFNGYFEHQGQTYYANDQYISPSDPFLGGAGYYNYIASFFEDTTKGNDLVKAAEYRGYAAIVDSLNALPVGGGRPEYSYYTVAGTMLMGRFSLNFAPFLGENIDLKIYGEAALLGIKNYPIFYEDPVERMPMMFGINIPTFGLLTAFGVEVEYWKNPYINSYFNVIEQASSSVGPIPDYLNAMNALDVDATRPYTKDDLKWSLFAKKSLGSAFSAYVQVARDHVRQVYWESWNPTEIEILLDDTGWYYAFRIQMDI